MLSVSLENEISLGMCHWKRRISQRHKPRNLTVPRRTAYVKVTGSQWKQSELEDFQGDRSHGVSLLRKDIPAEGDIYARFCPIRTQLHRPRQKEKVIQGQWRSRMAKLPDVWVLGKPCPSLCSEARPGLGVGPPQGWGKGCALANSTVLPGEGDRAAVGAHGTPVLGQVACRGSHVLLTSAPLSRGGGLLQLQEFKPVCEWECWGTSLKAPGQVFSPVPLFHLK